MTKTFLFKAQADDLLGAMFAALDDHAGHTADWFGMTFGGPDDYLRERGDLRLLLRQYVGLRITEEQRGRWIRLMTESARETDLPEAMPGD
ncbi:globin domain-containing protein [Streptomyces mirabilis]|uniref:globin domain-containing protein n=1 Tax=Streptomyces mirabilis TaxID=68239 RepID=UPI003414CD73